MDDSRESDETSADSRGPRLWRHPSILAAVIGAAALWLTMPRADPAGEFKEALLVWVEYEASQQEPQRFESWNQVVSTSASLRQQSPSLSEEVSDMMNCARHFRSREDPCAHPDLVRNRVEALASSTFGCS